MSSSTLFKEEWLLGPSATKFYTRTYAATTPKAVIVFIHGFAEHIGRYEKFHSTLATEHGITVFTFDQRGFGRTAMDEKERSKGSQYGKTGWVDQMADIRWAVERVKDKYRGVPVFLMGQSMGGGEVLGFATETANTAHSSTVSSLSGVISLSPLIILSNPASKAARWVGGKLSAVLPNLLIPAPVAADALSHDPDVGKNYLDDPLVKTQGSLRGVGDMLGKGEELLAKRYKDWPKKLPVLFIHGDADRVTSHTATQSFYDKVEAEDKTIKLFPDGFHELSNEPGEIPNQVIDEIAAFITNHLPPTATSPTKSEFAETKKSNL